MAIKGLSKFVVAPGYEYDDASNKVTYSESAAATEKLTSYEVTPNASDDNNLYGDNAVAETADGIFTDASIKIGTTELTTATSKKLYRIKTTTLTAGEKTLTALVYDDSTASNVVGVGLIEEHQDRNKDFYRGVILPKVKFKITSDSAETRGDSISWKTPEIEGTVLKSDEEATKDTDPDNPWKIVFDAASEKEALDTIKAWFEDHKKTEAENLILKRGANL